MHKEDWDDLRIVLAVSRTGSFARAARVLEVNESTVVRKVAHAEQRFRARLFERKPGKVSTTEAGQELVLRAEQVEGVIREATNVIRDSDGQIAGTVRVTSVPLLVNRILIPELPKLVRQHPNLQVELVADARVLSLARREADIALRLARPTGGLRAIARKVGELSYAVYGPQGMEAADLPWLTYESDQDSLPQAEWMARQIVNCGATPPMLRTNDGEGLLACAQAGLGKTVLPQAIGDSAPGLVRLHTQPCDLVRELWMVVHPDLRKLDRVRVVMDWVVLVCGNLPKEAAS